MIAAVEKTARASARSVPSGVDIAALQVDALSKVFGPEALQHTNSPILRASYGFPILVGQAGTCEVAKVICWESVLDTTVYLYDGTNLIEELDGSGNVLARYTEGGHKDEWLAETRSGTTSYYQQDGLGSSTSLSNSTGALANTYTYDSFGKLTSSTGTLTNPFRYTGREFDSETGLYFYRARYFDPNVGRFLSEDPLAYQSGPNYYSYVSNSPARFIDPAGLVQIDYNFVYTHYNFWYSLWNAGGVHPHASWHGTCTKMCDDKWKLNLTLSITFDIAYSSESNLQHEEGHVAVGQNFFNNHRVQFEAFEHTFGSEAECKRYLRNRLDSDVLNQLNADQPLLDQEQSDYDWPWGWWND